MKKIPIYKGFANQFIDKRVETGIFAIVDDEDFEWLNKYTWVVHLSTTNDVYASALVDIRQEDNTIIKNRMTMHRLIMGCKTGDEKMVDHKDGCTLNYSRSNLRFCNHKGNSQNKKPTGFSKFLGVSYHKKGWRATIRINEKQVNLGRFENENDAAYAYNKAAATHFGEFARLNKLPEFFIGTPKRTREDRSNNCIKETIEFIEKYISQNNAYPMKDDLKEYFNLSNMQSYRRLNYPKVIEYKATLPPELFKK